MAPSLDTAERDRRVDGVRAALEAGVEGSRVQQVGSLARGDADAWSDIDLTWEVAAARFGGACDGLRGLMEPLGTLGTLRWDSAVTEARRRLVFIAFDNDPLFWHIDLEIVAVGDSILRAPAPVDTTPSQTHDALRNAVEVIRSLLRGDAACAAAWVSRGFEKIAVPVPAGPVEAQLSGLVETIYDADDTWALLAQRVRALYTEALNDR